MPAQVGDSVAAAPEMTDRRGMPAAGSSGHGTGGQPLFAPDFRTMHGDGEMRKRFIKIPGRKTVVNCESILQNWRSVKKCFALSCRKDVCAVHGR